MRGLEKILIKWLLLVGIKRREGSGGGREERIEEGGGKREGLWRGGGRILRLTLRRLINENYVLYT